MTTDSRSAYQISSWFFLRAVAAIFLIAFLSLWVQIEGLIGSNGILPAQDSLGFISERLGISRFFRVPTVFWLSASDGMLHGVCALGVVTSIILLVGIAAIPSLILLWFLYLSLVIVGFEFLSFQWDNLLLETGFIAIFIAPLSLKPGLKTRYQAPKVALFSASLLLFKLVFQSGVVKLGSGDRTWRELTALNYHYETQPLPTWLGWYAHQLPEWFQKFSVIATFGIELIVPFLIFAPKRFRLGACAAFIGMQTLIIMTGNYCFFNLLTIGLCLFLIDDRVWPRFIRERLLDEKSEEDEKEPVKATRIWKKWVMMPALIVFITISSVQIIRVTGFPVGILKPVLLLEALIRPFRTINSYGLFSVMTTKREEIVIEGSNDGRRWESYEFKWKPQNVKKRPGFVAPHQPRLDWQMWFAALSDYRHQPWLLKFLERLLEGSPEVLRLLSKNPFPDTPPQFVRAAIYDYQFSDPEMKKKEGVWWVRKRMGLYFPTLSLRPME